MRVRYTIPGWQPTMPRGVAPVLPPVAFREMVRSRQGIPDTDWKETLRAMPRATLAPSMERPALPRGLELQGAEYGRASIRMMIHRLPATGGAAVQGLRALLQQQAAFENRILAKNSGGGGRG
ncbi:MAG: hypothetical protein KIT83_11260 [Bryobacterales bacterium]|nr:hypothetical protein [Bryobacterales bacterium]